MNKKISYILFMLFYCAFCFPASFGFETPSKIFLPGEIFTNNIVINYDSFDNVASGIFLNVQWESDTVGILTALWSETDFTFDEHIVFNTTSNQYSNIFLYSSCQPNLSSWNNNTNLTIVKLICVVKGRELCDFEFNDSTNSLPFPASAVDENGKDILGDPNVLYDGFDVLSIITRSTAGYIMSADLSADNIAIVRNKTNIVINLRLKKFGRPMPYEHIRATLDYDDDIIESHTKIYSQQPWLKDIQFTVEMTNMIRNTSIGVTTNLEPLGTLIFEAKCAPTNFIGELVQFHFKPIDYDESEIEFDDTETFVKINDVNLLGLVDEDDDGLENSIVYVLPSGKMRYILKMEDSIGEKYSESKAKLFVTSEKEEYFDDLNCSLFFNENVYFSGSESYDFKLNPDFTNMADSTFYTENIAETNNLFNQSLNLDVFFDDIMTNDKNELIEIGEITWMNSEPGIVDFFFDVNNSYIEFEGRDLIDDEKQNTEFPVSMQITDYSELSTNIFLIKLIPDTLINYVIEPGKKTKINVCGINNYPVSGSGELMWKYDRRHFKISSLSPNMWTNRMIIKNGSLTSDVFGISGPFVSQGGTTIFGNISFQAMTGNKFYLEPLREMSQITNFWEGDIIGSTFYTNDGVFGITLVSKEPEEVFMRLKPNENLFAGKYSKFVLELLNPLTSSWTSLRAEIEIDEDELLITNKNWDIKIDQIYTNINIDLNQINKNTNFYPKSIVTPSNSFIRISTSITTLAVLQLSSDIPIVTKGSKIIGSFEGMPLEDEIMYDFYIDSQTGFYDLTYVKSSKKNGLNENLLSYDSILDQTDWIVAPSGVKIWMKINTTSRPTLQKSRTMYVNVDNPNNAQYNRVTLAWSYDSDNFEILSAEKSEDFGGEIWIENHDDGDGYLCADLTLQNFSTNSKARVLSFEILPKLTDTLEMNLDEIDVTPENEIIPGVWQGNYNLLETIGDDVYDNYQEWKRGIKPTRAPLLYIEDIDGLESSETILDLKDSGTGMEVYNENDHYKWWAVGNNNVNVEFNCESMIAKIVGKDNWTGQEIFWIYCQNLDNGFVSRDSIKIDVHNSYYEWNEFAVNIERDDYFTITDVDFNNLIFNVINPPNNYSLNAFIIINNITNAVTVVENNGTGHIEWHSPTVGNTYFGSIVAVSTDDSTEKAFGNFSIQVLDSYSNKDIDGDEFEVKINNSAKTLEDPTRIYINGGSDNDKIKVKVRKNKDTGDGIVNFDEIISDSGIKSISLDGGVNLIQANGPIGSVKVKRGIVGQITSKNGGVKSVKISTAWSNEDEAFYEVGLLKGISAQDDIGTVKVTGGNIGEEDAPAIISSANGNIKTIITKMTKKVYWDGPNFWDDIYIEIAGDDGANIYANIYAPNGNIGSVKAIGGRIGSLLDDADTEISSGSSIKTISAVAKSGDGEIIGGFIHSDISADGNINKIMTLGGDICGSTDSSDTDGSLDETELITYPVIIYANSIKNISAKGKVYGFRYGPTADDAEKEAHGGNVSSYIVLQNSISKISSKAGNISVYLKTKNNIKNIKAKSVRFKECWDDDTVTSGGNLLYSVILPNVKYYSKNPADYKNTVNKIDVSDTIKECWIGLKGSLKHKIISGKKENFDLWIDGQKID